MSTPNGTPPQRPVPPPPPPPMAGTPNAEKYVLEADAMRRRQLRSALLHGSRRTWREHPRVWPAIVVGVITVAVVLAAMAVVSAYQKQKEKQEEEEESSASSTNACPVARRSDGRLAAFSSVEDGYSIAFPPRPCEASRRTPLTTASAGGRDTSSLVWTQYASTGSTRYLVRGADGTRVLGTHTTRSDESEGRP